jgi:flagellar L-ring protein precursor FlgH
MSPSTNNSSRLTRDRVSSGTTIVGAALLIIVVTVGSAQGQDSSLLLNSPTQENPLTLDNSSFIFQQLPPGSRKKELGLRDIITVLVDYRSSMLSEGDAENRRVTNLNAVLADWLGWDGQDLFPAPQQRGDLRINGQLNSQYRTQSELELRESLTFPIAAEVVDIRPNGNLVIQADRRIRINDEVWQQSLTGEVDRQAIGPDRTVRSDMVANLRIEKKELGFIRDSYARGWFTRWYDKWKPF